MSQRFMFCLFQLERILYYQKLETDLIESYNSQKEVFQQTLRTNTDISQKILVQDTDTEYIQKTQTKPDTPIVVSFPENDTIHVFNSLFRIQSKSAQNSAVELDKLESRQQSIFITRNKSVGDILNQDNDCIDNWKQIEIKSASVSVFIEYVT